MSIHRTNSRKLMFALQKFSHNSSFTLLPASQIRNPQFSKSLPRHSSPHRIFSAFSCFFPIFWQPLHLSTLSGQEFEQKPQNPNETPRNPPNDDENPPEDAQIIFRKMKETGLVPNAVAMLDGLCKDGLVHEAMKLFGEMRQKGAMPEVVVYTAVVEGFCKALKLDDAKRIFRKMQANGFEPNAFSYGVLIQGLCRDKKLEDGVNFTLEMLDKGWRPNVATYVSLIDGFCKEQRSEEAKGAISQFRAKGFLADERAIREYMDKKGPFFPSVWEVMFGKRGGPGQNQGFRS
uniref:TSA: Wollemia nobilis Ref_Wollemi_Transcript_1619_1202 transcribed RNA sequence n=1 Tax=Wollemia nobilis TaxID=56998 RepID=A0A0C9RYZ9_9CONI